MCLIMRWQEEVSYVLPWQLFILSCPRGPVQSAFTGWFPIANYLSTFSSTTCTSEAILLLRTSEMVNRNLPSPASKHKMDCRQKKMFVISFFFYKKELSRQVFVLLVMCLNLNDVWHCMLRFVCMTVQVTNSGWIFVRTIRVHISPAMLWQYIGIGLNMRCENTYLTWLRKA